jgi:L-ascorbate metabolism protein UlaG (beta-lactamase superfamily)
MSLCFIWGVRESIASAMPVTWRNFANWAKKRPRLLRAVEVLGRGHGRLRPLDHFPVPRAPIRPDLTWWNDRALSAVWIGHATVLLRIGGMTILTDPVFSNRVGIGWGFGTLGPRRLCAPAIALRDLPPVDLILISHAHFDHLDRPTLVRMRRSIPIVTSEHNGDLIRDLGFRHVRELCLEKRGHHSVSRCFPQSGQNRPEIDDIVKKSDVPFNRAGESVEVGGVRVTARRVPHWGPRVFVDDHRAYCAFLIESPHHRVVFGGDSAGGDHFDDLRDIDLSILGIGGYDPYRAAHATPEEAWEMSRSMHAKAMLPMHHSTFRLSYEPVDEPMRRLLAVAGNEESHVVVRRIGETFIG